MRQEHLEEPASVSPNPHTLGNRPSLGRAGPWRSCRHTAGTASPLLVSCQGGHGWAGLDCICEVMSPPSGPHPGLRPGPSPLSLGCQAEVRGSVPVERCKEMVHGLLTQTPSPRPRFAWVSTGRRGMNYLSRCPWGQRACTVACTPSHGRGDMPRWGGCRAAPRMRTSIGEWEVVPTALGDSAEGGRFGGCAEGPGLPESGPPGCGPAPALCSPAHPIVPYLPPPQPGQERPRLSPRPRKSRQARDQRTRGNGRGLSAGTQPIRWRKADGPEASGAANPEARAQAAGPTPRRQGAAERRAAGGGERAGWGRGWGGFPASPGAEPGERGPRGGRGPCVGLPRPSGCSPGVPPSGSRA